MQNTHRRFQRRRNLQICLILLALALVLGCLLFAIKKWESKKDVYSGELDESAYMPPDDRPTIWYGGQEYVLRDTVETILLMGIDTFEESLEESSDSYVNNQRTDFLMLLVLDHDAGTCKSLHIDRDTMVNIHMLGVAGQDIGTTWAQLALAHTYGSGKQDSCRNTIAAVKELFYGTPIDHYLSVTMDGVQILNDEVGGVTVTVLDDMTSVDSALVKGATVTLRGEQALKYVRSRSGLEDSTNRRRMERQRQYLDAMYTKLAKNISEDEEFAARVLSKLSSYLLSDCQPPQLTELLDTAGGYRFEGIGVVEGESTLGDNHLMEFTPDEEKLQQLIIDLFYEPAGA